MIIYALIAQVSVAKMFAAGYVPGLIMAASLMVTVSLISRRRGYQPLRDTRANRGEVGHQFLDSVWSLSLPFGIILGLRFGRVLGPEAWGRLRAQS